MISCLMAYQPLRVTKYQSYPYRRTELKITGTMQVYLYTYIAICNLSTCSVMVTITGNELGDQSSNPRQGYLHFTLH